MAQTSKFRGTARSVVRQIDRTVYSYHNTAIVQVFINGVVRLNSGGWRTNTTKLAMNQASNEHGLGFGVWQKKGEWFVTLPNGDVHEFVDGMEF